MTFAEFALHPNHPHTMVGGNRLMTILVLVDLLVVTLVVDLLMQQQLATDRERERVALQNLELAAGRDEIARSNQGLADYQHMLEALLDLSRSLNIEMPRQQVLERICHALHTLVPVSQAAAVMECDGQCPKVLCHDGFGQEGPDVSGLQDAPKLSDQVMASGNIAMTSDASGPPEIRLPRIRNGPGLKSALGGAARKSPVKWWRRWRFTAGNPTPGARRRSR